jgi:hypothetical protein
MLQSAKQHSEAQALGAAAYFQAEKHHRAEFRQAADMDARSFEMSWRAEVREALRDELANLNNRFNNVMLCDTVCLGCVFGMISDGDLPPETSKNILTLYVLTLGVSIMMFTTSLWSAVIIVRRLNESTASTLERKLFFSDETLQALWKQQLEVDQPTGEEIIIALAKVRVTPFVGHALQALTQALQALTLDHTVSMPLTLRRPTKAGWTKTASR